MEYPWYNVVQKSREITQGDIITDCPIVLVNSNEGDTIKADVASCDVIVLSQACDLANNNIEVVTLCPLFEISEMKLKSGELESIRQGRRPRYHMVNQFVSDTINMNIKIIDFANIYSIPVANLTEIAFQKDLRIRLLPPYREHLSQAFARFFMRIGLPLDIPRF